jgi:tRNA(Ile)-lysidine synthase
MRNNIFEKILRAVRNYDMFKPGDTVLVAVSGGPDSVFLLIALKFLQKKLRLRRIVVCNLDHGIRAGESGADSFFVEKMAEDAGLGFIHKKVNIPASKPKNISVEEAAREQRYKFFAAAAQTAKANVIATGHTLDDQAETVLMRIIKGASLKGLVGISPVRHEGALRVVRPLFELEKKEIEKYLDDRSIEYRIDSTNLEPVYFRNVVRKEILPGLEKHNPRLKRALCNLAEHLREDFEFIRDAKGKVGALGKEIRLKDIAVQPKAIQKEIMRDLLESAGGEVKRLSFRHWKELEHLISRKGKGSSVDLPGDIRVTRTSASLVFRKRP